MKTHLKPVLIIGAAILILSCSHQKFICSKDSYIRQKGLKSSRLVNVVNDIMLASVSVVTASVLPGRIEWKPNKQQFTKLKLINPTADTIYVNMLTNVFWNRVDYCDFMDIRIPPKKLYRILVPLNAEYNIYYSNTPQPGDDELLQIDTGKNKKLVFQPGEIKEKTNETTFDNALISKGIF
jgi:hypothetical protein